ncbi:MAG: hypothetical protein MJ231_00935 [bacterium]|nr:hypothetical protein [bacterium]
MQISLINSYYNINKQYNKPAFRSTNRVIDGFTYQTTRMMRKDFPWRTFPEFFEKLGRNFKDINIYDFACSDGSETWSLKFCLRDKLGEKSNKFKIKAFDIDPEIIHQALSGKCNVTYSDTQSMNDILKEGYYKYAYREYPTNPYFPSAIAPKDFIKDNIFFDVGDMVKEIDKIEWKNNIILNRNCLAYLSPKDREAYIKKLGDYKDKILAVAIGDFDKSYGFDKLLEAQGYRESDLLNIYVKA